jgi:hypothetical protein
MKAPRTKKDLIAHPAVLLFERDEDGYWCYLREGWYCEETECRTIHEHTIRAVIEVFETVYKIDT